ncbi:MAG: MAPEG family protein [Gammaproteobacteria bacterium]
MNVSLDMLGPVVSLVAWSLVMCAWMFVTRLTAVRSMKIKLDPNAPRGEQMSKLPAKVRWKADNYNHLMEQPTLFYALAISVTLMGEGGGMNLIFAWLYVVLRVMHSLIQSLVNKIEARFVFFLLSNVPLFALAFNAVKSVFGWAGGVE